MVNLINLIYPNVCGICDKISNSSICKKCELMINDIIKWKVEYYKDKNFTKHFYLFDYKGVVRENIINYKFNDKSYLYRTFLEIILKNKKIHDFLKKYDIIIPVPIHKKRKNERGYNQSELIAKEISNKILNLKFENKVVEKIKNTLPQSSLTKKQREENVQNVYKIINKEKIENKKIIIFDDIYTTGSTVNAIAKILKENGAKEVSVLTIAKDEKKVGKHGRFSRKHIRLY